MAEFPANTLFVTGTDTAVGKTYVCARLLEFLTLKGVKAGYQKWVATGVTAGLPEDLAACLRGASLSTTPELTAELVPYSFGYPASPHLAAEMENRRIDPEIILAKSRILASRYDWLIIEGIGGLMVPLRRDLLLLDLLARVQPMTLVVSRSGLGTLNHTLLTLAALRQRQIPVLGVVLSDAEAQEDERLVQDNLRTIAETGQVRVFGRLRRQQEGHGARSGFVPVGQAIWEELHQGRT